MDWGAAFDKTLKEYGITARLLSERVLERGGKFSQQSISAFRNGKSPINVENLSLLLREMPQEAVTRYFSLVAGEHITQAQPEIEELVLRLPKERKKEIAILLIGAIAGEPGSEQKPTQKVRDLATL
ncbi:MAG: hypothetical protein F6K47_37125 [Symploca sp. SIO2E6]|nr:hypothetical protein [Symploca sp. SIO2E6]